MIRSILSGILGVLFLTGAFRQYRCRGPIWSAEYIASSPKEKKRLRTRQAYYLSATACLLIGISFVLLMIYGLTEISGFVYAVCVLTGLLFLLLIFGCLREIRRSMNRGPDSAVHRRRLEEEYENEAEEYGRIRRTKTVRGTSGAAGKLSVKSSRTKNSAAKSRTSVKSRRREEETDEK